MGYWMFAKAGIRARMAIAAICVGQGAEPNLSLSPHIPVKSNNGFSSCAQDIIKILFRFIERTAGGGGA